MVYPMESATGLRNPGQSGRPRRLRLGLRARLFLASVGLIAVSLLPAYAYLTIALDRLMIERIREDLAVRAGLIATEAAESRSSLSDIHAWDALADSVGQAAQARVTIIRKDGVVLGDSELSAAEVVKTQNHAERPEMAAALSGQTGVSSRFSSTLGHRLLYVAVPLQRQGRVVGAVRASLPLEDVDNAQTQLRGAIGVGLVLALLAAALMSSLAAHLASGTVRQLAEAARAIARGGSAPALRAGGPTEFLEIGRTLDDMAGTLSRALADLKAERDRLGGILADMQEGLLVLDGDGRIALVNPALRRMFGLGQEVTGRSVAEATRSPDLAAIVERARDGRRTEGEFDLAGPPPRRVLVRAAPQGFEPGAVLAVLVDVTEVRRLEAIRRDFVANASHELRTPVATVRSAAETLRDEALGDPVAARRFVEMIARNADRLQRLVEDLLDLSRLESGEFEPVLGPVAVSGPVGRVVAQFRERAEARGMRLTTDLPPDLPPVQADGRALEQIVTNLVDNAIKYGLDGAEVCVGADLAPIGMGGGQGGGQGLGQGGGQGLGLGGGQGGSQGLIRIWVRDSGPGIEPTHLPRLFERFYRVDAGRSRELGGTGLGLAIVKHLAEAMGGSVGVESMSGHGSRFHVLLKVADNLD